MIVAHNPKKKRLKILRQNYVMPKEETKLQIYKEKIQHNGKCFERHRYHGQQVAQQDVNVLKRLTSPPPGKPERSKHC